MRSKRLGFLGALIGATLLFTAAGLALAQEPTPSPSASPTWSDPGRMMGGQGMMGGMSMMDGMSAEQMAQHHEQMIGSGVCDPAQMQEMHAQHHPER